MNNPARWLCTDLWLFPAKPLPTPDYEIEGLQNGGNGSIIGAVESGGAMKVLPKADSAEIPERKLTHYALNPSGDKNKAYAFKSALGFDTDNANLLIRQIKAKVGKYPAKPKGHNGFGETYEVIIDITGPNGKTAKVLTGWIDDESNGEMRLVTLHVD